MILLLGGVVVAPIFLVSQPTLPSQTPPRAQPYLVFQNETTLKSSPFRLDDPTVYLLPTDQGFSSRIRTLPAQSARNTMDPIPTPSFIEPFETYSWSDEYHMEESLRNRLTSLDPKYFDDPKRSPIPETIEMQESSWMVQGPLSERVPTQSRSLPKPEAAEILSPRSNRRC
jgi:hypothetical protein